MQRKDIDVVLAVLLTVVCVIACTLFTFLHVKVFDTSLVYQGF